MSLGHSYLSDQDISLRPVARPRPRRGIRKETLVRVLLTGMFYLTLLRTTGMWYGYPSNFNEDASVDPIAQKLMLYSLIPLIGLYFVLEPNRFLSYFRRIPVLVLTVIIISTISLGVSISFGASIRGIAAVAVLTVAPLLYRCRYGSVETFRLLATFGMFAAFANILYTIALPRFGVMGGSYAGMVKGLFYHKNGLGQFCAVSFITMISLGMPRGPLRYSQLLRWAALLCTLLLIVVSKSSTAVVMVAIGVATLIGSRMMQTVRNSLARSFIVFFFCLFFGAAASFAYLGVAQMIADAFGKDLTFSGRTNIWEQLMPLVYDRPLLGYGFAVFRQPEVMEQYVALTFDARSTHNTYLELALNIGIPGMIAWTAFILQRLGGRLVTIQRSTELRATHSKEVAIILLIVVGSMMEAGMMLAPVILWPYLVVSLPLSRVKSGDSSKNTRGG
ncbi:O-antigen ligase family protein [Rhizobium lentis]|uniref:O-antigen ligase family protein n=1 Tax=Rhizobium lentis TaxID=1138194 RepID=UPI001A915C45|nr:O-antigen ligase family protein [Rhizobium lentis]MBX5068903.1 O-antigen ligase family protein [Rhizobium lentis]MBX5076814.1 O-antigen ligase family protein [Rhizobium lentis]QSW94394.1 O-antigen ligase family protein [Rhizobium lentis]